MTRFARDVIWTKGRVPVALVEILGASWAFVAMARLLLGTPGVDIFSLFLVIALCWFSLVGLGGVWLLRGHRGGWTLSVVAQACQLLQWTVGPVAYRLLAGPQVTVYFLGDRFYFFAGLTTSVNLFRGQGAPPFAFGVNLVAGVLLLVLAQRPDPEPHAA